MPLLITGLTQLLTLDGPREARWGKDALDLGLVENGAVLIDGEKIAEAGTEKKVLKNPLCRKARRLKVTGVALPSFVDSHTHAVFAEPRLADFSLRTSGFSYQEIKEKGGGIISSVKAARGASPEKLLSNLLDFSRRFLENGTGTVEVKSGYGLDLKSEIKLLETIKKAAGKTPLEMLPTFLGAHAIPPEFGTSRDYLDYLVKKVLPEVARKKLAVFADVFCEKGYFGAKESLYYLAECKRAGLTPKIHAEQMGKSGGSAAAASIGAISADHVDYADREYLRLLKKSGTIATLLPASNYFLGLSFFPDYRKFVEEGVPVCLATDFNPGTSPCLNMQFVISAAATHMRMKIEEAITASTINGACALGIQARTGMLQRGMQADISVFDVKDYREVAYYFGSNLNKLTIKKGKTVYEKKDSSF